MNARVKQHKLQSFFSFYSPFSFLSTVFLFRWLVISVPVNTPSAVHVDVPTSFKLANADIDNGVPEEMQRTAQDVCLNINLQLIHNSTWGLQLLCIQCYHSYPNTSTKAS